MESTSLAARYRRIQERVAESAHRADRSPETVTLVAISKYVEPERIREAYALGIRDFGESRASEALDKRAELQDLSVRWHFIGHLQTNKVKRVVGECLLIHSVDSFKLAEALSQAAVALKTVQPILLQINVSGEKTKYGLKPDETPTVVDRIVRELPGVRLDGLMTMAPFTQQPETARPYFRRLRELRDRLAERHPMTELSMGMSQDYAVAVEEGATLIRIGTGLFGERPHGGPVTEIDPAEHLEFDNRLT
ncbi:MAG TPA: YggS family pyridoxal phosphate-dependent enzyme [Oscillatoriaceae cyanobacterium]